MYIKQTDIHKLHTISGIPTLDIRTTKITEIERYKCIMLSLLKTLNIRVRSCSKVPQIETEFHA